MGMHRDFGVIERPEELRPLQTHGPIAKRRALGGAGDDSDMPRHAAILLGCRALRRCRGSSGAHGFWRVNAAIQFGCQVVPPSAEKGLLQSKGGRGDIGEYESYVNCPPLEQFLIVELTATVRELTDHGGTQGAVLAVGPVDAPRDSRGHPRACGR